MTTTNEHHALPAPIRIGRRTRALRPRRRGTAAGRGATPAMGPPNRPPGVPTMGADVPGGHPFLMGGPDRGPRASVMGIGDCGTRLDLFGESAPELVDSLFHGRQRAEIMKKQSAKPVSAGSGISRASGFQPAVSDPQSEANIDAALDRNRAFAAAGGHQGAVVFPNLRLFVITCLDPRVDPAHFFGLALGDAIVVRNAGGRVTHEVINDVAFISQIAENVIPDGPLFEVAVIHHTQCGAGALADDTFRHRYADRIGADESAVRDRAVLDPAATVSIDVERLRSAPAISSRVAVSGHVYDVGTGLVDLLLPACVATGATDPAA